MVLCILATDDDDVKDVALQIHFTLIQAFCCENDINILRVNSTRRLAEILGGGGKLSGNEPLDLHCVLVTVSAAHQTALLLGMPGFYTRLQGMGTGVKLLLRRELAWTCCLARDEPVYTLHVTSKGLLYKLIFYKEN